MKAKTSSLTRRQHEAMEARSSKIKTSEKETITVNEKVRKIPVHDIQDVANPAYVRVEASVTKNMQNYESIRVGVAIEYPCAPNPKDVQRTYEFISDRVEAMVTEELDLAQDSDYFN